MIEKVALLDSINPTANTIFTAAGSEVITYPKSVSPEDLAVIAANVQILGVRSGPKVTAAVLGPNPELVAISVFGVGTNHIQRKGEDGATSGADDLGIAIFNSAHENTRSVAELIIGSTFSLMRGTGDHNRKMHDGTWTKEDGHEVLGKTIGIIGYGAIGGQVSVLAEGLGMSVVYFDPAPQNPPQGRAKRLGSLEAVLETADVVTLHVPGGDQNRHMINEQTISLMKPGSYLINAARGELVDYKAAAAALASGHLGGIAADVFDDADFKEPAKKGDTFEHVLRGVDGALLTPHIGGSTAEAQRNIGRSVATKSVAYLETGNSMGAVNIPNLSLGPVTPGATRLLNIHTNQPGVMAELTSLVAEADLNVVNTAQAASEEIGYVAFDVEGSVDADVVAAMGILKATRRLRVLA
jgi:D-3-phosphoglycerate dehydrogenase